MFIDWFKPLKKKLSGEQLSFGLIALNCLNLPPCLRYQTKYTCLAGLIHSPNQPTMIKINNVLIPLVNELYKLNRGIIIPTSKYPCGRKITVKLATLVGDIVSVHKEEGFKSHLATTFCSLFDLNASDCHKMDLRRPQTGRKVLNAAQSWKDTPSEFSNEDWNLLVGAQFSALLGSCCQCHLRGDAQLEHDNLEAAETYQESPGEDSKMSNEKEINYEDSGYLTEDIKRRIRERICKVIVPKGATWIPPLVGKSQIGKLKA
ncbi:hypothetical protein O181_109213, partial [Austropuccinia psidii MF-1]|nr:hypothetical protein [Austropuccinia psidii MF-1]